MCLYRLVEDETLGIGTSINRLSTMGLSAMSACRLGCSMFRERHHLPSKKGLAMSDLIYVVIVVAFFAVSALYVRFCEKL